MPSLQPIDPHFYYEIMSTEEPMDAMPTSLVKTPSPMDLSTKMSTPPEMSPACYRTPSIDSLITDGSLDDNEIDTSDTEFQQHVYRPRLPTADMILTLNKHKRRSTFKLPSTDTLYPLNLCTKDDNKSSSTCSEQSGEEVKLEEKEEPIDKVCCSNLKGCICKNCSTDKKSNFNKLPIEEEINKNHEDRFDWSYYRRSMSCSQIDFRFRRRLAASGGTMVSSDEASPAEQYHEGDDGFHDEVEVGSAQSISDITESSVKKLIHSRSNLNLSSRTGADGESLQSKPGHHSLLMNEPPEAFVHTLEQLSFRNQMQGSQPSAFLQSLTDQYVPHQFNTMGTFPVDAYGYYAHLMQRLQNHHVFETANSHHFSPNLSMSPPHTDDMTSSDSNNLFAGMSGKKRPPRALTGRHVREGTGASPSTLVSLRKAIEDRQKMKKPDSMDCKYGRKKSPKSTSVRPRAYSASLTVRTVAEDVESDNISVASE